VVAIHQVSVTGLAGRRKPYTCTIRPDINIFFGPNGSGKTGLLKILHAALEGTCDSLLGTRLQVATVAISDGARTSTRQLNWPEDAEEEAELRAQYSQFGEREYRMMRRGRGAEPVEWIEDDKQGTKVRRIPHRYLSISRLMTDSFTSRRRAEFGSEHEFDAIFAESLQQLWRNYTNRILSEVRAAQETGLARILRVVLSPRSSPPIEGAIDPADAYRRVQTFLSRQAQGGRSGHGTVTKRYMPKNLESFSSFKAEYEDDPTLRRVVNLIDEVERSIEDSMKVRESLQELVSQMVMRNKEIRFTDSEIQVQLDDGQRIGLARLSSGEKQLLRILVETTMANDSPVIIDEPELSMHIDWQRRLIAGMRSVNPTAQIIVATHSPDIMANWSDETIFRL